jgi:hypothetical protein
MFTFRQCCCSGHCLGWPLYQHAWRVLGCTRRMRPPDMTGTWTAGKGCSSGFRVRASDSVIRILRHVTRGLGYRRLWGAGPTERKIEFYEWPRMETVVALLSRWQHTFVFHKIQKVPLVTEGLQKLFLRYHPGP